MLEALLGNEKLTDEERTAFGDMRRKIRLGYATILTKPQKEWVERRYLALELDADEPSENLFSKGAVPKGNANGPPLAFETQYKPLKPPGRK